MHLLTGIISNFKNLPLSKWTPKYLTEEHQQIVIPPSTINGSEHFDVLPKTIQWDLDVLNCKDNTLATSEHLSSILCSPTIEGHQKALSSNTAEDCGSFLAVYMNRNYEWSFRQFRNFVRGLDFHWNVTDCFWACSRAKIWNENPFVTFSVIL